MVLNTYSIFSHVRIFFYFFFYIGITHFQNGSSNYRHSVEFYQIVSLFLKSLKLYKVRSLQEHWNITAKLPLNIYSYSLKN